MILSSQSFYSCSLSINTLVLALLNQGKGNCRHIISEKSFQLPTLSLSYGNGIVKRCSNGTFTFLFASVLHAITIVIIWKCNIALYSPIGPTHDLYEEMRATERTQKIQIAFFAQHRQSTPKADKDQGVARFSTDCDLRGENFRRKRKRCSVNYEMRPCGSRMDKKTWLQHQKEFSRIFMKISEDFCATKS